MKVVRLVCFLVFVFVLGASIVSCSGNSEPFVGYKPDLLPVEFVASPSGISIEGESSIATPMGTFSIGAKYELPQLAANSIYVYLRDKHAGFDHIYEVRGATSRLTAIVNGKVQITVTNSTVVIEVASGSIERVEFQMAKSDPSPWYATGGGIAILLCAFLGVVISIFSMMQSDERKKRNKYERY